MTAFASLFGRVIVRPLRSEPVRTALTVLAVALGVAVTIAIDLAGEAAAGSFRSSLETLSGDASLEIAATGGLDEKLLVKLAMLPLPLRFAPRIEGFAVIEPRRKVAPVAGVDVLSFEPGSGGGETGDLADIRDLRSIWVSSTLTDVPARVRLTMEARTEEYIVRGRIPARTDFILMDIGAAQRALGRAGRVDRIEVYTPEGDDPDRWQSDLARLVPPGAEVRRRGAQTEQNRKMLAAFRWNLRVLSYISLVVGAFLIYNTISVSVVRRRAEIGILRALGATGAQTRWLFLCEALCIGAVGSLLGVAAGRLMAEGAVGMLAATVDSLYVSSTPGAIALTPVSVLTGIVTGLAVSLAAAFAPAREASRVPPVEAMARGQREFHARLHTWHDLTAAAALAVSAFFLARMEPVGGRPLGGYAACLVLVASSALAIPAAVTIVSRALTAVASRLFGVEGALASRSILASLPRTAVLAGALSTAIAMMVSVGLMVGSFRATVGQWMTDQLQADLYMRPVGGGGANRYPAFDAAIADRIERIPGVRDVDRFRVYEISYRGMPALLGGGETAVVERNGRTGFLPGQDRAAILKRLPTGDYCIVSEPFANKHGVKAGDRLQLPLGAARPSFEVLGVYFDYSNERGYAIVDRATLLRHLPDPNPSSLAVYLEAGADPAATRRAIEQAAGPTLLIFSNASLRTEAIRIFDRTFAITWALEAVAVLVAVLGVSGALLALVIDRRREFGLLKYLGASRGQIRRMILCEAGILGLLSLAAGTLLGYALSLILIYVINVQSFGWTIQFHWPLALLAGALSAIFAATVLAGLYPARIAQRLNPIEVIHEE